MDKKGDVEMERSIETTEKIRTIDIPGLDDEKRLKEIRDSVHALRRENPEHEVYLRIKKLQDASRDQGLTRDLRDRLLREVSRNKLILEILTGESM